MSSWPRWENLRLRTRLTLLIGGVMLVLGGASALLATVRARATLEAELAKRGLAIARDLAEFSVKPLLANDLATLRRFVNYSMNHRHVRFVSVLDPDGAVVMHSDLDRLGTHVDDPLSLTALASEEPVYDMSTPARGHDPLYEIFVPITAAGARLGTVALGYSRAELQAEIARARREILWVGLLISALGGALVFLLSSCISRPIRRIAAAMESAPDGGLHTVVGEDRGDEIGLLAASFNKMTVDLSRHRKHLNELVEARTAALKEANVRLESEVAERRKVEDALRKSRQELRDLASHLVSVREQERSDIAREIHDELGQALTALKLDVHWVGQRVTNGQLAVVTKLAAMSKMVEGTIHTVRRISSQLRPKLLDDLGLSAAMEWQAREFEQRSGVRCGIRSEPDDIVLDAAHSTTLFRIFQETLTNVARHAEASRVDVVLKDFAGTVEMRIADDGRGISPEEVADGGSLGIVGMRERVRSLGGRLEITGHPGRGTVVHVALPGAEGGGQ